MDGIELLSILRQGPEVWNTWRKKNLRYKRPDLVARKLGKEQLQGTDIGNVLEEFDLSGVDLRGINLEGAHLASVDLSRAKLESANLKDACLIWARLDLTDLTAASLVNADLRSALLFSSKLSRTCMRLAKLDGAMLINADLVGADLTAASLVGTTFMSSWLHDCNLEDATLSSTVFVNMDLRRALSLESCRHLSGSSIDFQTLGHGGLPVDFLQGCGLKRSVIDSLPALLDDSYDPCFISYSSKDEQFANRLYRDLLKNNVSGWKASESLQTGEDFPEAIENAIRKHERLIVILSANALKSTWVRKEVEIGLEEEQRRKKTVICPILIDDAAKSTNVAWAVGLHTRRHIGDFSQWKTHSDYDHSLNLLLRDLEKKMPN